LETNLQHFITSDLSFFAAQEDNGLDCCLWTGIIGSAPGHRIIAQAIENILGIAVGRIQDKDVLERSVVCKQQHHLETMNIWKFRSISFEDAVFGSCALGMAFNTFQGAEPLASFLASLFPDPENSSRYAQVLLVSCDEQ
jgi:hypothetical protein